MATLADNITQAISDFDGIKDAIVEKGVDVPNGTPTSEYGEKVREISGGDAPSGFVIDPRWNWYDLKELLANDESEYTYKVAEAIYDSFPTSDFTISGALEAVKTSDGAYYTSTATHTWDTTQDRQLYDVVKNADGTEGVIEAAKARWVIKYYDRATPPLSIPHECFYFVADGIQIGIPITTVIGNSDATKAKKSLIYFDFANGAGLDKKYSAFHDWLRNCYSLRALPDDIDLSHLTGASYLLGSCHSFLGATINLPLATDISSIFSGNYAAEKITINAPLATATSSAFNGCRSIASATLDVPRATTIDNVYTNCSKLASTTINAPLTTAASSVFSGCYSLTHAELDVPLATRVRNAFTGCRALSSVTLNIPNVTDANNAFSDCDSLVNAKISGLRTNLTIGNVAPYLLSRDSIMYIIEHRNMDVEGSITLTIGATNIAKLSDEEKAIAAAQRITLA